jgi:N-acetylmuramoyl-L-alanine amidase
MAKRILISTLLLILLASSVYIESQTKIFRSHIKLYEEAEVYIQAGHEGRTKGATGTQSEFGREIDWTPIVADEATRILREAGISVIRSKADRRKYSRVNLAVSIHFDGCNKQCATGASIGYDDPTDKPAAIAWKQFYSQYFKFHWKPDNFTPNLANYYNFKYTITKDAELVLELGDLTCPEQAAWLKANLNKLGHLVAYFAAQRIGKSHLLTKPNTV